MAVVETTAGDKSPRSLVMGTRAVPVPGPNEVLIKVAAAGINRPDCLQRMGLYRPPPDASDLLGLEVAGVCESVGANVDTNNRHMAVAVGAQVCALTHGGGYAEYVAVDAGSVMPVPLGQSKLVPLFDRELLF